MEKILFTEDKLNRKELAKKYVKILHEISDAYTIALDAPWGSGKSKVIDFMCEIFEDNNDLYVKYNAWENDYTNEPFLSLLNHIFNIIKKNNVSDNKLNTLKEISLKASKIGGKSLVKGLGKFLVGMESVKELESLSEEVVKSFISSTADYSTSIFNELDESKKSRDTFVLEFKETIKTVLNGTKNKKIYIIIDELDRCKPTFSIELLEQIKHLFEMDELVFFIAVDNHQLSESLKSVYGNGFDSKTYLHRFFNIELHLDTPNICAEYINERLLKLNCYDSSGLKSLLYGYNSFDLTLRDIERIITEVRVLKALNNEQYIFLNVLYPLLILKYKFNDVYLELKPSYDNTFDKAYILISSKNNKTLESFFIDIAASIFDVGVERNFDTYKKHNISRITINQINMIEESTVIL
jgi:KAP family P-loop domain